MKFLAEGVGTTADAIKAIAYAERMGARIVNLSRGNNAYDAALHDALRRSPLLFVAGARGRRF